MAQYKPLFYRGAPASIPQVVAHLQKAMSEEDPDYTPLRQRMPPASIPDIVAHIQKYLTENAFVTMEDLGDDIAQYIEDHPEVVGVFTVNGSSGDVVLDAGNIPLETGEDPTIAGAISYLSSQLALLVADAVLSVNGVTPDDSHDVTLTGADIAQDGSTTKKLSETFGPASASAAGSKGLVPAPQAGDENRVLSGSGAWVDQPTGAVQTVCSVGPNAQGNVPLKGSDIPLQSMSLQTVAQAIAAVGAKTGSDINTSSTDNTPISSTLSSLNDQKADQGVAAYVEHGDTVTKQNGYKYGEYIVWKGTLYTVNASSGIAYGETIAGKLDTVPAGGFNDLIWKRVADPTVLPSKYNELFISVDCFSSVTSAFVLTLPYVDIPTTPRYYRQGYYISSNSYMDVFVYMNRTRIQSYQIRENGTVITSNLTVYYR